MAIIDSSKYPTPRPSKFTIFLRTCVIWQLIRFLFINIKMTVMIAKSHGSRVGDEEK